MDHDEDKLNNIVLPLMNVSRRLPDNTVNLKEPNQQQIYMTSASVKTSFAYLKLIDLFEDSIIDPELAFVFGCDYKVPMRHGLLDKDFVNHLKMSPSYNERTFAAEYKMICTHKILKIAGSSLEPYDYNIIVNNNKCECIKIIWIG